MAQTDHSSFCVSYRSSPLRTTELLLASSIPLQVTSRTKQSPDSGQFKPGNRHLRITQRETKRRVLQIDVKKAGADCASWARICIPGHRQCLENGEADPVKPYNVEHNLAIGGVPVDGLHVHSDGGCRLRKGKNPNERLVTLQQPRDRCTTSAGQSRMRDLNCIAFET